MINLIKYNTKFVIIMISIIIIGVFGITYSLKVSSFNPIATNITTSTIDVDITYDQNDPSPGIIESIGKMRPIRDREVAYNSTDERIIKSKFYVQGNSNNPTETIYDVAIHNLNIDCSIRTENLKWRLYKNGELKKEGTMSPDFDAIDDDRLVLTDIQEDLSDDVKDEYVFILWISETCNGDNFTNCNKEDDQSIYLNKTITGEIKLELTTKSKKSLVRSTGRLGSCTYTQTNIPICNSLTYDGKEHKLINEGNSYTIEGTNIGKEAREYSLTAKLKPGFTWTDSSTNDKTINCTINKRNVNITAKNQNVSNSNPFNNVMNDDTISVYNLAANHNLSSINLTNSNNKIIPSNPVIVDENNINVTSNYNINLINGNVIRKEQPTMNVNIANSILLIDGPVTYSYTINPDNLEVNCSSSNTNIATCSINKATKKITITPIKTGNVIITLESSENVTYDAYRISKNLQIACSPTAPEPEVKTNLIYNGEVQRGVEIDGTKINGLGLSETDAGDYTATLTPIDGYCWEDTGTAETRTPEWKIERAPGSFTCEDKIYDGTEQTACSCSGGELSGDYKAKNYSSTGYTATCAPQKNYIIDDNIEPISKNWTMNKAPGSFTCEDKIYDGTEQTACSCSGGELGGDYEAEVAGNYTATCPPDNNHIIEQSSKEWIMNKATSSCTITNMPNLDYPINATGTISYNCTGDGNITITSSNPNVLSLSNISDTSATLTTNSIGSSNITISISEGDNYLSNNINRNVDISYTRYTVSHNSSSDHTLTMTNNYPAYYLVELWGGKGGRGHGAGADYDGGAAGYVYGVIYIPNNETIFATVGGNGLTGTTSLVGKIQPGGTNGGGSSGDDNASTGGSGGGYSALAIGTTSITLANVQNSSVKFIAGAGAGSSGGSGATGILNNRGKAGNGGKFSNTSASVTGGTAFSGTDGTYYKTKGQGFAGFTTGGVTNGGGSAGGFLTGGNAHGRGGGGGAGYYGGGGGSGYNSTFLESTKWGPGGGGGGSSFVASDVVYNGLSSRVTSQLVGTNPSSSGGTILITYLGDSY